MIESLSTGIREIAETFRVKPRRDSAEAHAASVAERKKAALAEVEDYSSAALLPEKTFRRMLCQERKRSERSRKSFLLMLVRGKDSGQDPSMAGNFPLQRVPGQLASFVRETDLLGWFETDSSIGAIFSELGTADIRTAIESITSKTLAALQKVQRPNLQISFHAFPESLQNDSVTDREIYPDLFEPDKKRKASLVTKRVIDVIGSALALIFLSPVIAVLAMVIKLTSRGPVFFRQERLGQFQVPFVFLKFRSMYVATDTDIHEKYVRNFIAGRVSPGNGGRRTVYKLINDPRITGIGSFMRRTSLDEVPQFWNVFKGQMSLVGPRPAIRYEIEAYDVWHRRRLLEAKPGITGLWQVRGRSRTTFDEMVRLDLQYSKASSLALDLKILLQTPLAVFSGDGAY